MITFISSPSFNKKTTFVLLSRNQIKRKKFNLKNKTIIDFVNNVIKTNQFSAEKNQIFPIINKSKSIILAGIGNDKELSLTDLRIIIKNILLSKYIHNEEIEIIPHRDDEQTIKAVIEGILIGSYRWQKYISNKRTLFKKVFIVAQNKNVYKEVVTICNGVNLTRDLVNDNADLITSDYLEKVIRKLIKGKKNISLEVLNKKQLKAKGLNLHLAVNQGSAKEPKLIIVKYKGENATKKYTAIVGKGITFDTGGLNLKGTGHIESMRQDMGGTAAVMGTLSNIINLKVKKNIIFACGIAENAIGSKSYKPGDVIRGYSNKTVEIENTDAEGRLVLADAISYVIKKYDPEKIIDIATLTGSCIIALGYDHTGLISNDEKLAEKLLNSANETDDRVWRLPIYSEIQNSIKSKIADIKNIGYPRGAAGTITAGEFLRRFIKNKKWAHLDIAGTAFIGREGRMYFEYGATGAGVRLLTHYLKYN